MGGQMSSPLLNQKNMDGKMSSDDSVKKQGVFSDFGKQARDVLNKYYYNSYSNPKNKAFFLGLGSSSHADFLFTAYPFSEYPEADAREGFILGESPSNDTLVVDNNSVEIKTDPELDGFSTHILSEGFILGEFSAAAPSNDTLVDDNNSVVEIKTNPELDGFSTHIVSEIVPKAVNGFITMKYPDLDGTSKVGIQCLFPPYGTFTAATFTSATLKNNFSKFHYSGTIGYGPLSLGGDFVISDPNSSYPYVDIKDYSCGIRFMNSDFDANIGLIDKGDTLSASCVHYLSLNEREKSCVVAEFKRNLSSNENTLTIGGKLELKMGSKHDTKTTMLKAKVDNHGTMGVVLQQQLFKDTKIRMCCEFDHKDLIKGPMIGLSFIL